MKYFAALTRTLVGAAFGVLSVLALLPALATMLSETGEGAGLVRFSAISVIAFGALIGFFAPSIRRALGRGFLLTGVTLLALPLSAALLSAQTASQAVRSASESERAFAAVGAGLGGAVMTGAAAFIGLILGSIFVITGLVLALGGRRQVEVSERK